MGAQLTTVIDLRQNKSFSIAGVVMTLKAVSANKMHKSISLCGQYSVNPKYAALLLGLGLTKFQQVLKIS